MKRKPDLVRRDDAVLKTIAKYRGRPFSFDGDHCVAMLRSHLVAMGHRKLPEVPKFKDAKGALRALQTMGFADLEALLDSLLPRIAPAAALPGDVLLLEGDQGLDSVMISTGYKAAGWHESEERMVIVIPHAAKGAWRA